jgi:hypothetical protein
VTHIKEAKAFASPISYLLMNTEAFKLFFKCKLRRLTAAFWVCDPLCLSSSSALHFSDYYLLVRHPVNRDDRHLLAHAMASDFTVAPSRCCCKRPVYTNNVFCVVDTKRHEATGNLQIDLVLILARHRLTLPATWHYVALCKYCPNQLLFATNFPARMSVISFSTKKFANCYLPNVE